MKILLSSVLGWLKGKKTYLLAVLLVLITVGLVAANRLTPAHAFAVMMIFVALFAASFRAILARHEAQILPLIVGGAVIGRDLVARNVKGAEAAAAALAPSALELAQEIKSEQAAESPTGEAAQ